MILRLTVAFAIIAVAITFLAVDGAQAEPLDAAQFRTDVVGKKLETKRLGISARLVFSADGRVAMKAPIGAGEGTWTMDGTKLCTTMTSGPQPGTRCGTFTKLEAGRYQASNGQIFTAR